MFKIIFGISAFSFLATSFSMVVTGNEINVTPPETTVVNYPHQNVQDLATQTTTTTSTSTTTTLPQFQPPSDWPCVEYFQMSIDAGWTVEEWPKLGRIMYRESRCIPTSFNPDDPNGGSYGLGQVNGFWCRPSRWTSNGFLQDRSVLSQCTDLYDPFTNLLAMRTVFDYSEEQNDDGWFPWRL